MESNEGEVKTAPAAVEVKATPVVVKLDKAALWASEGRCTICGKVVWKADAETGAGDTCKAHIGKIRQFATESTEAPEGWVRMSKVCRAAEAAGFTTSAIVKAAGGDAATDPLLDPMFRVVYVGRAKYMDPRVLTEGFAIMKKAASTPKAPSVPVDAKASASKAPVAKTTAAALKQVAKASAKK